MQMRPVAEIYKRILFRRGNKYYIAAVTAITAVGAAARHIFFPPEGNNTVSALPAPDKHFNLIHEQIYHLI